MRTLASRSSLELSNANMTHNINTSENSPHLKQFKAYRNTLHDEIELMQNHPIFALLVGQVNLSTKQAKLGIVTQLIQLMAQEQLTSEKISQLHQQAKHLCGAAHSVIAHGRLGHLLNVLRSEIDPIFKRQYQRDLRVDNAIQEYNAANMAGPMFFR